MQNDQPSELDQAIERVKQLVTTSQGGELGAGSKLREFMQWLGTAFPDSFNSEGKPPEAMSMPEYRNFRQQ